MENNEKNVFRLDIYSHVSLSITNLKPHTTGGFLGFCSFRNRWAETKSLIIGCSISTQSSRTEVKLNFLYMYIIWLSSDLNYSKEEMSPDCKPLTSVTYSHKAQNVPATYVGTDGRGDRMYKNSVLLSCADWECHCS